MSLHLFPVEPREPRPAMLKGARSTSPTSTLTTSPKTPSSNTASPKSSRAAGSPTPLFLLDSVPGIVEHSQAGSPTSRTTIRSTTRSSGAAKATAPPPPLPSREERSLFPVYDHSLPLSKQHYYPTTRHVLISDIESLVITSDRPELQNEKDGREASYAAYNPELNKGYYFFGPPGGRGTEETQLKQWRISATKESSAVAATGREKPLPALPPPSSRRAKSKSPLLTRVILKLIGFSFDAIAWLIGMGFRVATRVAKKIT